jgi:hypothetical protein
MRFAAHVVVRDADDSERTTKHLTAEEFQKVQRATFFTGATAFWRQLERLADPEQGTRIHAMGVLRELARSSFEDCQGFAYSVPHFNSLTYAGFSPAGVRSPGSSAESPQRARGLRARAKRLERAGDGF